ncbi:hypothetical protein FGO68_gene2948 [Halteria grandinella]|uniref:Uncharacterized protein n=1 Tax=Halteria grandinella TaxID=5974 RepID=A0A8J8P3A8_HALGN|nr:hypothetical protein FGO68_gene2948 [Halteria grandinella]
MLVSKFLYIPQAANQLLIIPYLIGLCTIQRITVGPYNIQLIFDCQHDVLPKRASGQNGQRRRRTSPS